MGIFTGNRYEYFKFELLTLQNGEYKHAGYVTDYITNSNVKIDFTRDVIGTANFEIRNNASINYLADLIRPWYCFQVAGVEYTYPMGTYMLFSPTKNSDGMIVDRTIQAYDLLLVLDQDKTTASSSYSAGTTVVSAITTLLDSAGTWVKYSIEPSAETLSEAMSYEMGKSKLFIINSLLNTLNYYPLWCNGNGVYKSIPWSENKHVAWEFLDNNESLYESGIECNMDYSEMYNKVVIVANQLEPDTDPLISTLTFEDIDLASHPFSHTSIGRYITKIFQSEAVSQAYLDLRANRELLKMLEVEESITYNHAFVSDRSEDGLPYQGDCYRFKNTLLGLDDIYSIESQTFNLKVGSLVNSVIRRVSDV